MDRPRWTWSYLAALSPAAIAGMTPVISYWSARDMRWLDSAYWPDPCALRTQSTQTREGQRTRALGEALGVLNLVPNGILASPIASLRPVRQCPPSPPVACTCPSSQMMAPAPTHARGTPAPEATRRQIIRTLAATRSTSRASDSPRAASPRRSRCQRPSAQWPSRPRRRRSGGRDRSRRPSSKRGEWLAESRLERRRAISERVPKPQSENRMPCALCGRDYESVLPFACAC